MRVRRFTAFVRPYGSAHRAGQDVLGRDRNIPPNRLSIEGSVVVHKVLNAIIRFWQGRPGGLDLRSRLPAPMCQAQRASRQPSVYILPRALFTVRTNAGASWVDAGYINTLSCVTSKLSGGFNAHEDSTW